MVPVSIIHLNNPVYPWQPARHRVREHTYHSWCCRLYSFTCSCRGCILPGVPQVKVNRPPVLILHEVLKAEKTLSRKCTILSCIAERSTMHVSEWSPFVFFHLQFFFSGCHARSIELIPAFPVPHITSAVGSAPSRE